MSDLKVEVKEVVLEHLKKSNLMCECSVWWKNIHSKQLIITAEKKKWPFQRKVDVSKLLARKVEEKKDASEKWF